MEMYEIGTKIQARPNATTLVGTICGYAVQYRFGKPHQAYLVRLEGFVYLNLDTAHGCINEIVVDPDHIEPAAL
jgi:hypothetical protein